MEKNKNQICPNCNKKTEHGYLGSESLISGIKWFKKKKMLGTGGELIKDPGLSGMVYIDAFRCKECRIVTFKY